MIVSKRLRVATDRAQLRQPYAASERLRSTELLIGQASLTILDEVFVPGA